MKRPTWRHPGWLMLALASLTVFMSAPGQSFSVAAFVDPMLHSIKLGRTDYSLAYMVATLIGGISLPFVGRLVDRLGARIVLPIVALLLGLACGWMSRLSGLVGLYIGFTMIRCLGQGSLTLISNWIIGEWFNRRRGLAAGVCAVGGTASVFIIPRLNHALINDHGWRFAWVALGTLVAGAIVIPAILFLRDRPEPLGFLPDFGFSDDERSQRLNSSDAETETPISAEQSFTVGEAMRCATFWKIAGVVATVSLVGTGLMFHQVSILGEQGVSPARALEALGIQAIAATVSTLIAGYLIDRMPARIVLAASMFLEVAAILLLLHLAGSNWAVVYSALLGLHGGIIRSAGNIVWINYFGRKHQGSIQGVAMCIMVLAAAIGPVPLANVFDAKGTYEPALWAFLALPMLAGIAVLTANRPHHAKAVD